MSSDLYWLPPPQEQKRNDIGYLKHIIGQYYESDYNGGALDVMADKEIIPFLKGIVAAGTKEQANDAQKLISAIEKHGQVQLIIGW